MRASRRSYMLAHRGWWKRDAERRLWLFYLFGGSLSAVQLDGVIVPLNGRTLEEVLSFWEFYS